MVDTELMNEVQAGEFSPAEALKGDMLQYLVAVCELDNCGNLKGTHHVSSTVTDCPEKAKKWAINDTACDWGYDLNKVDDLHILFVMTTPIGVDIGVVEYDEGVL